MKLALRRLALLALFRHKREQVDPLFDLRLQRLTQRIGTAHGGTGQRPVQVHARRVRMREIPNQMSHE